jgi:DNA primase
VPKKFRHDHLPGQKGYFNALTLINGEGPLFVTEGPFDALSLVAAGCFRAAGIFGVNGWRWEWARHLTNLVLALDADSAGQSAWRELARQSRLRGKQVAFLPPGTYGGHKDINEAWKAGVLNLSG